MRRTFLKLPLGTIPNNLARVEKRPEKDVRVIARNRKARHNYQIQSSLEAGIELKGHEVKSLREGKLSLGEAYAYIEGGEVFLKNLHINPYKMSTGSPVDPLRVRRLLLHRREIARLLIQTEQKGMTLVPLSLYFRGKVAKVELGLAIGRKKYDKRAAKAELEAKRRIERAVKKDVKS